MKPKNQRGPDTILINGIILNVMIQESGLTLEEVAEQAGVGVGSIKNWIWGKHRPQVEKLYKVARVLNVPLNVLVMSSEELQEYGRTSRVVRYYAKEAMGANEDADYREIQLIESDLASEAERESAEEETRQGEVTVFGEGEPSEHSESDIAESDEVPSEGVHMQRDSGERKIAPNVTAPISAPLRDTEPS